MIQVTTKLTVKELAGAGTGWTTSFLYKARMAGLPMERDQESRAMVATPASVRRWIKKNNFRIVRGRVKKG